MNASYPNRLDRSLDDSTDFGSLPRKEKLSRFELLDIAGVKGVAAFRTAGFHEALQGISAVQAGGNRRIGHGHPVYFRNIVDESIRQSPIDNRQSSQVNAIEIRQLSKSYGRRVGVEKVSFAVPGGAIFGFLGPNGAGKTTTIRVLLGLLRPSTGSAAILGRDCWSQSTEIKNRVGYLPGDLRLYPWLNARRAIDLIGRIRRCNTNAEGNRLITAFDLDPNVRVKSMSRGMRQKLGLILALAHRPAVVILDEPTASLDPLMQGKLYTELRQLASAGSCVFLSSHTLDEVEKLCERVAIIREGKIVADETIEGLRAKARRMVTLRWQGDAPDSAAELARIVDVFERGPQL